MGRGRAKAKQTKVARDLKYRTAETDFEKLQRELQGRTVEADQKIDGDSGEPYDEPYARDPSAADPYDDGTSARP